MACGSARIARTRRCSSGVHGMRPSCAHNTRRSASHPSHAPPPSSETGRTPAADTIAPPLQFRPADGSGSDHEHAAIAAVMRADAGRARVRRDRGLSEGMLIALRLRRARRARSRPPEQGTRQSGPGHSAPDPPGASSRSWPRSTAEKLCCKPETNIGRTGHRLRRAALPTWPAGEPDRAWHRRRRQGGVSGRSRPSAHVRVILPESPHLKTPRERIAVTGIVIENTAPGTLMVIK